MNASPSARSVAVLGASSQRHKFGNRSVRAYAARGDHVFPINLHETQIEGWPVFRSLKELPQRPDVVSVYLPPAVLLPLLPEIAAVGCDELWLNPGTDTPEVVAEATRLGLPVIQACSLVAMQVSPD